MPKRTIKKTTGTAARPAPARDLQKAPAFAPSEDCRAKVLDCIGQQSGGTDLSGNPTLRAIGVQGFLLAGCLNEMFGLTPPDAFKASDFPPTMTVLDCTDFVCQTVGN